MKIVATGDWHGDAVTLGVRRHEEVEAAALEVAKEAVREEADAFFFLGDLADPEPGAFWALQTAARVAAYLTKHYIPSYWLTGNHDVVEDSIGTHCLQPLRGIGGESWVVDYPSGCLFEDHRVRALFMPYTSTARTYDPAEILRRWRESCEVERVIIAHHLMLEGISAGSETADMRRGRDVFFPIELARELYPNAIIVSGHYHHAQTFKGNHMPGSLVRLNKAESEHNPGYLVLEV